MPAKILRQMELNYNGIEDSIPIYKKEVIIPMEEAKQPEVEVLKKLNYIVKQNEKKILDTTDLNEAIRESNRYYQSVVLNEAGDVIHESTLEPTEKNRFVTKVFVTNNKVIINNKPVYNSPASSISTKRLNGTFYIADDQPSYGRYLVKQLKCSTSTLGYINAEDLE